MSQQPKGSGSGTPSLEQAESAATLQSYGIVVSHTPVYEWGGYRYSSARDAIAAAKRIQNALRKG